MALTRDLLLGATEVPTEVVFIPSLNDSVIIRGMTGKERDAFEASCWEGRGKKRAFNMQNLRAKLVMYCCVDAKGQRLFTDQDAEAIGNIRADIVDRCFAAAQKLSGMTEEDLDELGQSSAKTTVSGTPSSPSPTN